MAFEHTVSRNEKLVRLVGRGELDFEICVTALRALAMDLRGEQGYGILVDVRETDYVSSSSEIRQYAALAQDADSLRGHRLAIVVTRTVQFGMGRMFATYLEMLGGQADVFRDEESAMDWLTGARRR